MIIIGPIGPEQTLDFLCAMSTLLYIFFEGISPVTRYYSAVIELLRDALSLGISHLRVYLDAQLVVS